ncbi:MAG TPA: hypothetical protein VM867_04435 [Xanthobacteraceae bacterium]|nr:hypothetical protein [Xanthobacteraceae bacterium]
MGAILLAASLAVGCSTSMFSSKSEGTTSSGSVPFTNRISSLFGGGSAPPPASAVAATPATEEFDCPRIDIRAGASTLLVNASSNDPNALGLRYQGSFVRAARECRVSGGNVNIRIGVEGRVILGPAGGPGQVNIPLRFALVHETLNQSRPLWSKLHVIPLEIPPQTSNVNFTYIVEDLTVPIPPAAELENWVIYLGFDPAGAQIEQRRRPARQTPPRRTQQQ